MIKKAELISVKEVIPKKIEEDSILNIITNGVNKYTHGFHKYPAKFIPHIPRWAINRYLTGHKRKTIIDPFCGSGTTLVEGLLEGHNVIGLDIDPLSALISKVKITRVELEALDDVSRWLKSDINKDKQGIFIPECETIEHWFTKDAIEKLSKIRTSIDQIPEIFGDDIIIKDIQDLLIICFSSIIRRVSNADNQSQKTYVSHTNIKIPEEVNSVFFSNLDLFINRIAEFTKSVSQESIAKIFCTTATENMVDIIEDKNIGLAITSPPYIKAIDYIYNQMVELFWIGDIFEMQTQTKQNRKKNDYIGNKQIRKDEYKDYNPYDLMVDIKELDDNLQQIYDNDKKNGHKHSYVTYKYFLEMEKHFFEMGKSLNSNLHYVMVIGNSNVSNVYVNTSNIISKIAERNGFRRRNKWGYVIKNRYMRFDRKNRGGIIETDWVLDFERV